MYYHLIAVYTLLAFVIAALIYLYIDEFTQKTRIRVSLFTESASDEIQIPQGGFSESTILFSFDNRYERIKGDVKFYAKFKDVSKNKIIQVRIVDTMNEKISDEVVLTDERVAVMSLKLKKNVDFLRLQTKTAVSDGSIKLERLEIEYIS